MAGIYVHIPFCKSFCTYCDFYSICDTKRTGDFLDSLFREMECRRDFFHACGNITPSTLYIGGGTPSVLTARQLGEIARRAENVFLGGAAFGEFTVEVNPDDVSEEFAAGLKGMGVTRVSMGVQSFDGRALKWMNRRHDPEGVFRAYGALRRAGFGNLSLDLIFGYLLPGETREDGMERWRKDLETVTGLGPEHISSYQMSIEPGSLLGGMCCRGEYSEPDGEFCAAQYGLLRETLARAGYEHYEISNFARMESGSTVSGYRSAHNSSYWTREPYLGLGPAAHSFDGTVRSWNVDDVEKYVADREKYGGSERLSSGEAVEEKIMLGLRRKEGVAAGDVPQRNLGLMRRMVSGGVLEEKDGRIMIPPGKWFVSDDIIAGCL